MFKNYVHNTIGRYYVHNTIGSIGRFISGVINFFYTRIHFSNFTMVPKYKKLHYLFLWYMLKSCLIIKIILLRWLKLLLFLLQTLQNKQDSFNKSGPQVTYSLQVHLIYNPYREKKYSTVSLCSSKHTNCTVNNVIL